MQRQTVTQDPARDPGRRVTIYLNDPLPEGTEVSFILPPSPEDEEEEADDWLDEPTPRVRQMNSRTRRKRIRQLLKRDGPECAYCGKALLTGLPFSRPTVDHVVPISRGGKNSLTNLALACKPCNRAKADLDAAAFDPMGFFTGIDPTMPGRAAGRAQLRKEER